MRKIWTEVRGALGTSAMFLTFYSFFLQQKDSAKTAELRKALEETKQNSETCTKQVEHISSFFDNIKNMKSNNTTTATVTEQQESKILNSVNKLLESQNEVLSLENQIFNVSNNEEKTQLIGLRDQKLDLLNKTYEENGLDSNHYNNFLNNNVQNYNTNANSESLTTAEKVSNTVTDSQAATSDKIVANAKKLQDFMDNNPQESNVLGPITDMIDSYREFLSTLSLEQIACLANAIGFITIFFIINSIITTLFGSYLIDFFKLDVKFPKLAKILTLRKKVSNFYVTYNIIFLYLLIISLILVNLYIVVYS